VFNVSSWSTYTIGEGAAPLISYGIGTENAGELGAAPGSIYVNASVNSGGATLTNITFTLYNTSGVVNSTSYTGANALSVRTITWSVGQYAYDNYTYQVNVTGSNGLTNATDLRAIRFLPSCLDIGTCNETGNCVINTECYLFSSKCTNMSCDFANFTMGAGGRLYTLHDTATGNGMPLAINTSGSISFTVGSRVIFNGKNGSSISPGTVGGNASVINWTTSGLFNTTHGMFEGIGGYSTLTGVAGGNGGILQINAFGFIRQFDDALYYLEETDNMPLLNAGTSVSAIDGEEYNINTDNSLVANLPQDIPVPLFVKSLVCSPRIDVDVNGDGYVDFTDSDTIRNNYNTLSGESGFSDYYDINCDDKLNVKELARIGFEFERGA
jgi:hypothetical protein